MEYNPFVYNFRDSIADLKETAKTEIEPPSVKLARELSEVKLPQVTQDKEEKPPRTRNSRGYYQ